MFSIVLAQVEDYFNQASNEGLSELAKICKESQLSLTQIEWRSSSNLATKLIATRLLLAEIYSRQALVAIQGEYSTDNAYIATRAYQMAIRTCNSAISDLEVALKNDLTVDTALLQGSNSYKLDDPRIAKEKIKELVLSPLKKYLSVPDEGAYYSITPR